MNSVFLFLFGAAFGSFLNVVSLRYDPDKFLFARRVIGGRSHCPHCGAVLRWFELLPILSFVVQRGRCRRCKGRLRLQYPVVEFVSGAIWAAVPLVLAPKVLWLGLMPSEMYLASALWIAVFEILLLAALVDLRLRIIPDELNVLLLALGAAYAWLLSGGSGNGSFLQGYAVLLGGNWGVWLNHLAAAAAAAIFMGVLIALTRGRGMGLGDLKLSLVLGFVFGWPDIALLLFLAFVLGSVWGLGLILLGRRGLRSAVSFGPFLSSAALLVFLWGYEITRWYFSLFLG